MRKIAILLAASTALVFGAAPAWQAYAQMERGSAALAAAPKNFTPIQKAACGPYWGAHCGPWHHWVCGRYRCWCAPC